MGGGPAPTKFKAAPPSAPPSVPADADPVRVTWVAAAFGLLVGVTMTYLPAEFYAPLFRAVYAHIRVLGLGFLVGSTALAITALREGHPRVLDLLGRLSFTAALGAYWYFVNVLPRGTTGLILYPLMIGGVALEAVPRLGRVSLYRWFIAVVGLSFGTLLLFVPSRFPPVIFGFLESVRVPVGLAFFVGGGVLAFASATGRAGLRRLAFAAFVPTFLLLAYALGRARSWAGMELYVALAFGCALSARQKRPFRPGVRFKLLRDMSVVAWLPLLALGGVAIYVAQGAIQEELSSAARRAATDEGRVLAVHLGETRGALATLADTPGFAESVRRRDEETVSAMLRVFDAHDPHFRGLAVTDPSGRPWSSSTPESWSEDASAWSAAAAEAARDAAATGQGALSKAFDDAGLPTVAIARAIRDEHGVVGAAVALLPLEPPPRVDEDAARVLVVDRRDGRALRDEPRGHPLELVRLDPELRRAIDTSPVGVLEHFDARGRPQLTAHAAIEGSAWVVLVEQDLQLAYAPLRALSGAVVMALGLTSGLALLLSQLAARDLTARIRELRSAAKALAQGELGRRVSAREGDEIDELGGAFNEMADRIQSARRELAGAQEALAERLAERTLFLERAEAANRLKDEFLGIVSHELRTPLNAILGWARMLRQGVVAEHARGRALETIERNAVLQARLVEDLLDASRIITGKLELESREVALAPLVEAAVASTQPQASAKELAVSVSLPERPLFTRGDASRLQQAIVNVLGNAIKFTPAGRRVEVRLEAADNRARISVIDEGEGIDGAFLPHVFERFRQADASTTRRHGGLGLGLAIVRHLVEAHGGKVSAESEGAGRGATFRLELPVVEAAEEPARFPAPSPDTRLDGLRLLVVDDDADMLCVISEIFRCAGAEVRAAHSADEALAQMDGWLPSALVSDIGMPGEDGYSLLRRARAVAPDLPALALTAYARDDERRRVLEAGFQVHVAKPADPGALVSALAELVARASAARGAGAVLPRAGEDAASA